MNLSEISIRRPVFAWMLMFGLIVFGAISFQRMGISQMPDVNFPVVNIALRLDNAAPEVMEMDVVDIVEDAVMGLFDELAYTRQTLDRRYDDLESGRVKPIPGDEVFARLRAKSAARRAMHR